MNRAANLASAAETPPTNAASIGTCWILTDGKPGMENQCLGLARALGLAPMVKRLAIRLPWRWLTPKLWRDPLRALAPESDRLTPPWPDLLIASGRQSAAPAAAIRRLAAGRTFAVQIQDPYLDWSQFDAIVVPRHDLEDRGGPANLIATNGALGPVNLAVINAAATRLAERAAGLPKPRIAVLLGGPNRVYRFGTTEAQDLGRRLGALARAEGACLLVTPSRRTGAGIMRSLTAAMGEVPAWVWDGSGENPYLGFLGLADAIIVTSDSVSMISEACATGRPVLVQELPGGSPKFRRFHDSMRDAGLTRPFTGRLESWSYTPLAETARVAAEIARRIAARPDV
jgi:uncharacterized protein